MVVLGVNPCEVAGDGLALNRCLLDDRLGDEVRNGRSVVVACRGGLGRTGTAVACVLVDAGLSAARAIVVTRAARPNTIERGSQLRWVSSWPFGGLTTHD